MTRHVNLIAQTWTCQSLLAGLRRLAQCLDEALAIRVVHAGQPAPLNERLVRGARATYLRNR
jgi:hypothetical protein